MRFETFVALRYLVTSRRRAHVALIATISVVGLAVGVAALIVSLALLSGFQDRIRRQMMDKSAHLRVSPARGTQLADPERVRAALAALPGVVDLAASIEGRAWASDGEGLQAPAPVHYRNGARPVGESGVRITGPVSARLRVQEGQTLRLTSSRTRLSPIGPIPITTVLTVSEVRRSSALDRPGEVEVSESTARLLSGMARGAGAFEARLANPLEAATAARALERALGAGYVVATWRGLNAPAGLCAAPGEGGHFSHGRARHSRRGAEHRVQHRADRRREEARPRRLHVLGAAPASLQRIYLTLGAAIGVLGTATGVLLGVGLSLALERFRLVPLPADVYMLSHVPFAVHPAEVATIAAFALLTALAAAVLPARAAARLAPGEAIRLSR